ncbi:MAG: hypothetical protein IKO56_05625 [Alphaproteobacteria bacterium]|nr:hypothetical protein [Alphaproteobacteria bacterium]
MCIPLNSEDANDLRQEMAIAVLESIKTYNPDKIGKNFWAHANLRMNSRANTFVKKYASIVKIPINRQGGKHWEEMGYKPAEVTVCRISQENAGYLVPDKMNTYEKIELNDLKNAMDILLNENEKYVMLVRLGWVTGKSNKNDFQSISNDIGLSMSKTRDVFKKAKDILSKHFALPTRINS